MSAMRRIDRLFLIALLAILPTCGGESKGALGYTCSEAGDCAGGLACLRELRREPPLSGECGEGMKFCTQRCVQDSDCTASFGAGHICVGTDIALRDCGRGLCFQGSRCSTRDDPACK
jgi:hypothetical protein